MFGLFKTDPIKKLEKEYKSLMEQSFHLAKTDRRASDLKRAEAEKIADQIAVLKETKS